MPQSIVAVLMARDGLSETEANRLVAKAKEEIAQMAKEDMTYADVVGYIEDELGLEEDYMYELLPD